MPIKAPPASADSSRSIYVVNVVAACSIVFGRDTLRGILKYANLQQDWLVHVDPWDTTGRHEEYPETDGAIYAGGGGDVYTMLLNRSKYVVCCEASYDPSDTPIVSSDEVAIGRLAADHLLDCGYQHFAYYGIVHGVIRNVGNMRLKVLNPNSKREGMTVNMSAQYPGRPVRIAWPDLTDAH